MPKFVFERGSQRGFASPASVTFTTMSYNLFFIRDRFSVEQLNFFCVCDMI
jgi:hypothetical protein